ncbi:MAG: tRNA (guanosine(46)-N7)-methyltransferase TrmB [Actinomycetota bacterium]
MMVEAAPFQRRTVSFVRRESPLGPKVQQAWDENYERLVIDVPRTDANMSVAPGFELDLVREFGRVAPLVVEIGSGTGDAVVHGAVSTPGSDFLAVEVYANGLASTVTKIVHHELGNIRLVHADAVDVLKHLLKPQSVAELWIFFADPWHKNRHAKRRLVNPAFAELASSRLAPGGTLRLATDWADYAMAMRNVFAACDSLTNPHVDAVADSAAGRTGFAPRFEGRVMTRFEEKGLASGRAIYDLELRRT